MWGLPLPTDLHPGDGQVGQQGKEVAVGSLKPSSSLPGPKIILFKKFIIIAEF